MFIRKIQIESFRGLKGLEINFSQPVHQYFKNLNLSILVGENGVGKSSIFQLLTSLFSPIQFRGDIEKPICTVEYEINDENISYNSGGSYPQKHPSKIIVSSFSAFDPYDQRVWYTAARRRAEREELEYMTKYIHLGPSNRGYSSLDNVIEAIIESLYVTLKEKRKFECYSGLLHKIKFRRAVGLVINYNKFRELSKAIETSLHANEHMQRFIELHEEMKQRLSDLRRKRRHMFPNHRDRRGFAIDVEFFSDELFELYREILNFDIAVPFIKDVIFESENGHEVLLSEMSSGEITMLYRFLPLVMEIEDNTIVLIDEPETHLHPRWTREFISYLTSLFNDYRVHVLIATHSPTIASDVPMKCIVGLRTQEGVVQQYKPRDRTLGGHSNELLRDVFELEDLASVNALESIGRIIKLLERKRPNSEQINEARQIYNDLSTTSEKYRLYQKYKKFLGE